ncbi:MAG: type II secretion system F family protein, partial [Candidatus Aenigmarchaeota archaeon]|nr:type II secretion system F family protein [Candidatus Aenigmarchaeota archaeon]
MNKTIYEKIGIDKDSVYASLISICGAVSIYGFNTLYIKPFEHDILYSVINVLAATVLVIPRTFVKYAKYRKQKTIEERFPDFLRDIVEGLRGGMSLPLAINYTSKNNYGELTEPIRLLIAQISWGVPFEKAITNFASITKSKTVTRAVRTIIEAHRSGGNLAEVINAVGRSTIELEKIKRERTSRISSQMMQGYIIYFVFLGVMVGMQKFLIPALSWGTVDTSVGNIMSGSTGTTETGVIDVALYQKMFTHLAIIQGFFSGVTIGKLAEGSIDAGIKHAMFLVIIGYAVMSITAGM